MGGKALEVGHWSICLLRQDPIKPRARRGGRIGDLLYGAAAIKNGGQGVPNHGRRQVGRVLNGVFEPRRAGKLELKTVGQHHRPLQLRNRER